MAYNIDLTCPRCGPTAKTQWSRTITWTRSYGYGGDVIPCWYPFEAQPAPGQTRLSRAQALEASSALPSIGQSYGLCIQHPFRANPYVWVLFEPSYGWDNNAEELANTCWVRLQMIKLPESHPCHWKFSSSGAHYAGVVRDRIPLIEIPQHFEPDITGHPFECIDGLLETYAHCARRIEAPNLTKISISIQGDVGFQVFCHHGLDGPTVVAYRAWDFHLNHVYVGHRPLTPTEWDILDQVEIFNPT